MLTIRQFAEASGYSPATISLVLNNSPAGQSIPPSTREKIFSVARKLGYHPNRFARSLRSSRSYTVAVLVPDIEDPYCAQILSGIDDAFYGSHYLPVLVDIHNSQVRFRKYVTELFERRIDGVIAVANSLQLQAAMLSSFEEHNIPVIVIGQEPTSAGMSSVCVDNKEGGRCAIAHLYELGHRRIAIIKGPAKVIDSVHRWDGMAQFAQEAGLPLYKNLIVQLEDMSSSSKGGFTAMNQLLKRKSSFTAVVAFDDMTAFGAIRALTLQGRRVPEDCSVIGFDDLMAAAYYNPPLTTISQSMKELGALGVSILLERTAGNNKTLETQTKDVRKTLKPLLVVRESTARI